MAKEKKDDNEKNTIEAGITVKKDEEFSEWYTQVIQKAEMIEYSPVSGCMIIRPYAYAIWEKIVSFLDGEFKKLGVKNAYFPLFIPESLFKIEKEHVEGFNPEVAWVTHAGDSKLAERLAIRPTSETIMYDSYKKWIRSYKDLPLKLNQWVNIVRWEFKNPVPFLRTREFLWNEGHTAYAEKQEAEKENYDIIDIYAKAYEDFYAVPVMKGRKSDSEKFAGAVYTLSIETLFPNGKAIQAGTSHFLGQNFAKPFNISFTDKNGVQQYVWQNSWGFTTRSIGIMLAIHGDDKGLILPPKIAPIQIVIVPIIFENSKAAVIKEASKIKNMLGNEFSIELDDREGYSPGYKFNHWEMRGVPIRIELGPKDLEKDQVVLVRRDTGSKEFVKTKELENKIKTTLENVQSSLLEKAKKYINSSIVCVKNMDEFKKEIENRKIVYAFWCGTPECEEAIKNATTAKSLNIPFNQKTEKGKCINCNEPGKHYCYFAKSY